MRGASLAPLQTRSHRPGQALVRLCNPAPRQSIADAFADRFEVKTRNRAPTTWTNPAQYKHCNLGTFQGQEQSCYFRLPAKKIAIGRKGVDGGGVRLESRV